MFSFATFAKQNKGSMKIGDNLKKLRENKGLTQQEMADLIHTHRTGYSKMENNQQDIPVDCLISLARHFGISVDEVIYYGQKEGLPQEVTMEDKTAAEQIRLISQLDEEDKQTIFKLVDKMLTNKKFKDFFQKNIAAL
jgi:transcriptional regulator with XRE-family HTH domain